MAYPENWKEIRGVQFSNTAFREIYFNSKIDKFLKVHDSFVNYFCNFYRLVMFLMVFGNTQRTLIMQQMNVR